MSDGGKGSKPRPFSVTYDDFSNSFDRIFGKKEKVKDGKINNADQDRQDTSGTTEHSTTDRPVGEIK